MLEYERPDDLYGKYFSVLGIQSFVYVSSSMKPVPGLTRLPTSQHDRVRIQDCPQPHPNDVMPREARHFASAIIETNALPSSHLVASRMRNNRHVMSADMRPREICVERLQHPTESIVCTATIFAAAFNKFPTSVRCFPNLAE
jgi:hypothetical protein